jgi:hypothetical protein
MNKACKYVPDSGAQIAKAAPLTPEIDRSMGDKIDNLRLITVVVATQILFRATLFLRRWNY